VVWVQDVDVPIQALVPPLQHLSQAARRAMLEEPLIPVDVEGQRQFFLSARFGRVLDPAMLERLLAGQLQGQELRTHSDLQDLH
jgi:hypothetical protein